MPFVLHSYRRFPVVSPVTYEHGWQVGQGIVWNLSPTGRRLSGTLPLEHGNICFLTVMLPTNKTLALSTGVVRWVRGEDVEIETLVMDEKAEARLGKYIPERMMEL
jgi:hypothetical protein